MSRNEVRIKREIEKVMKQPPVGISLCTVEDNLRNLRATIMGVAGTPYESGVFKLDVVITDRYPFEPPHVRFNTPVYHPNIDNNGRICLELLKLPPSGCWRPVITIEGLLLAIQTLLETPNPDDPLMDNIAQEYRLNKQEFEKKAREHTQKYASQSQKNSSTKSNDDDTEDCSMVVESEASHRTTKRKLSDDASSNPMLSKQRKDGPSEEPRASPTSSKTKS